MGEEQQARAILSRRINDKHEEVCEYVSFLERRGVILTYANIIGGAIATALNAGLASGLLPYTSDSFSIGISIAAAILSLLATIAASLHKAQIESRLTEVQACAVRLEGLSVLLESAQLSVIESGKLYNEYIAKCPAIPTRHQPSLDLVRGTIETPSPNEVVERTFFASGQAEGINKDTHLWLSIEIDDRIWPKEGNIYVDNQHQWRQQVCEDGVTNQFSLSLWATNAEADRKIRIWLDRGSYTGNFPELRRFPGMRRIARVDGLCRKNLA
jgi:hypothetical protein